MILRCAWPLNRTVKHVAEKRCFSVLENRNRGRGVRKWGLTSNNSVHVVVVLRYLDRIGAVRGEVSPPGNRTPTVPLR